MRLPRLPRLPRALVFTPILLALLALTLAPPASGGPDGKAVFLAQKCNLCHSVDAAGIQRTSKSEKTKGPDLGGVTKRHDAEWIKRWLAKQEEQNGKKHLTTLKGSAEEQAALIGWLKTL